MSDNDLSIQKMMETAMGFAMAPMFMEAMNAAYRQSIQSFEVAYSKEPPRYIYAIINGKQQGPFSMGEILDRINAGEITPETYIWKAGMQEWKRAKDVEDIRPNLEQLPPPLPKL